MHSKSYRWAGAVATALGLFAITSAAAGQPPRPAPLDPIEAAKAQQSIAAQKAEQKAESDVLLQIDNADKLAKSGRTEQAVKKIKSAKADLQLAVGLSDAARTRLTGLLDAKLAAVEGRATAPNALTGPGFKLDPKGAEVKAANERAVAAAHAELADVKLGIERIRDYELRGQTALANAEIARLQKAYPDNPAILPLSYNDTIRARLADSVAYANEANKRFVAVQKGIAESALPAIRDVEFPKNWTETSTRRLDALKPKLSAQEKKIIEALDKPMSVNMMDRPFDEALQDVSNMLDVPLLIDKKSIEDLGLDLKRGSTLQAKGVSGRTVLRSILATQGLTFVVKDQTIQIVTVERAKSMLTTRAYYLGDLITGVGPFGGPQWGPNINAQQAQANVNGLIETIKKIDPLSWSGEAGGAGTVTYNAATQSIIVRNSAEVHFSLSSAIYGNK